MSDADRDLATMSDQEIAAERGRIRVLLAAAIERDILRRLERAPPRDRNAIEATSRLAAGVLISAAHIRAGVFEEIDVTQIRKATVTLIGAIPDLGDISGTFLDQVIDDAIVVCASLDRLSQPAGSA
jgi:hypothetical protein